MYCREKEKYPFFVVNEENSAFVLDNIGFGKEKCLNTNQSDGRYGYVENNCVHYGFENKMKAKIPFGKYFVYDYYMPDRLESYEFFDKEEFEELFEITNK